MPKNDVDYSNTIIYKIFCKDESITDLYVGHTTNFIQRKYAHKISCNNLNKTLKIYNTIRSNGGWDNWDMIEIAKYNCKDSTEARIKEQEHYTLLKASLNSCPPYVDTTQYFCKPCNTQCSGVKNYNSHINCNKHKNNLEGTVPTQKSSNIFVCELCNYSTNYFKDYNKHLLTKKHIMLSTKTSGNMEEMQKILKILKCENCSKEFKTNAGLWKHKNKVCYSKNNTATTESTEDPTDKQLFMMLLKQQTELIKENTELRKEQSDIKELILEIIKNGTHNTINNTTHTHTNSHNKAFNLNFFLNETCKNAMNITDFVDSIKLQLSDLIDVGEHGYVEGISKIIVKNLNNLDETERPIHCTDKKRETMYVKDQGQWEKEDEKNTKITKAVKKVADKNIGLLPQFREKYPEYSNSSSRISDKYDKMVIEVMETDPEKCEKIVKNISKVTTIKEK
jgi:hypothetical protein